MKKEILSGVVKAGKRDTNFTVTIVDNFLKKEILVIKSNSIVGAIQDDENKGVRLIGLSRVTDVDLISCCIDAIESVKHTLKRAGLGEFFEEIVKVELGKKEREMSWLN